MFPSCSLSVFWGGCEEFWGSQGEKYPTETFFGGDPARKIPPGRFCFFWRPKENIFPVFASFCAQKEEHLSYPLVKQSSVFVSFKVQERKPTPFCTQKEGLVHHRLKIEFADSLRNAFSRRSSRSGRARTSRRYPAYHEDMDCRMPDDETMQRMAEEYDRALRKSGPLPRGLRGAFIPGVRIITALLCLRFGV